MFNGKNRGNFGNTFENSINKMTDIFYKFVK